MSEETKKAKKSPGIIYLLNKSSPIILLEIFFVLGLMGIIYGVGIKFARTEWGLFSIAAGWVLIYGSLKLQRKAWSVFGFVKPQNWKKTIFVGIGGVFLIQVLIGWILKPWIQELTGKPIDLTKFEGIRGNLPALLTGLMIVWTLVAFGEEMVFRGYLMNRVEKLFFRKNLGIAVGIALSSLIFGFGHIYQGISGVFLSGIVGIIYAFAYYFTGRNLWSPILIHGLYDTWAFLVIFFSWDIRFKSLF